MCDTDIQFHGVEKQAIIQVPYRKLFRLFLLLLF